MKFVKESIELKGIEEPIEECIHPINEAKNTIRKWGHTWFINEDGEVTSVKTKSGNILSKGDPITDKDETIYINGFDPSTDSVFFISEEEFKSDVEIDGGNDMSIEDMEIIIDRNKPSLTEERNKISRRWGHTWYFDRLGNVEKVKAKDGTVLHRGERFQSDKDFYVINGFDPDTDTVFVVEPDDYDPHDVEGGADYAVEDVVEIFKGWDKQSSEEVKLTEYMPPLPIAPTDISPDERYSVAGYQGKVAILDNKLNKYITKPGYEGKDVKYEDGKDAFLLFDNDKDAWNYIRNTLHQERLREHVGDSNIYRVTYVVDKDANIFSAVMVNAMAEGDAQSIFLKKFPDTEILGIRELDDREVETNKKKGMSLIEDLDVDELESEEEATKDNPEPPVAGEESAAASIINSLIRDEWLAIEQYNSAMVNLKEYGIDEKIIEVLNHIMMDENTHVGNLQEVLALLAPATDKIEKGNEQAEQILDTENKEVGV